ncbi:MFS transporter [Actinoplanes regularis]|uniref:Predicted arabinose efflux permease, MFS family n=1 Tax=Actinoplanes regularis TaxID=52697 RepID=A0A239AHP8_9ACTN|nr:MFS transporter [Actinoplanes regularis]GIE91856.1 MFS transporter [Actinoplanes regularis]SNR95155.1 Predicted arabinose efflux permease, MFS family [Actinoplanes regularis]
MTAVDQRATYREVFAEPRFRVLFLARSAAITAESLRIFALSVFVFDRTGSALLSALAFAAGFLPQLVGGLLLGALTDRIRPRPLIVGGYLAGGAAALLIALVELPVAAQLTIIAAVACGTPIFMGAAGRLVAEVLTGDAYVLGRSALNAASSGAQLLGLAVGGVAVDALGAQQALLIAALGHALAALIVRLGLPDLDGVPGEPGSAVRASLNGVGALLGDPVIRRLLLLQWLPSACIAGAEALLVAYGDNRGFPSGAAGALMAALPLGMLLGDLIVGRCVRPATRERLVRPLMLLAGGALALLVTGLPMSGTLAILVISGSGYAYQLGLQRPLLDATPEARRGQMFALLSTGLMTLQGLSPVAVGALAQLTTPATAIAAAGAATMLCTLLGTRRKPARPDHER